MADPLKPLGKAADIPGAPCPDAMKVILDKVYCPEARANPFRCSPGINLRADNRNVIKIEPADCWRSAVFGNGIREGTAFWQFRTEDVGPTRCMMIGVCTEDHDAAVVGYAGSNLHGCAATGRAGTPCCRFSYYANNGHRYHNGDCGGFADTFVTGDVIGVWVSIEDRTIGFTKNGRRLGTAFGGIPLGKTWFPCISVNELGCSVTFVPTLPPAAAAGPAGA